MKVRRAGWVLAVIAAAAVSGPGAALPPSLYVLPPPPFAAFPAAGVKSRTSTRLVKVSERRNRITDEEAWLSRSGLKLPGMSLERGSDKGRLPAGVESTFENQGLLRAVESPRTIQLLYGPDGAGSWYVVGFNKANDEAVYGLDFRRYFRPPGTPAGDGLEQRVQWAEERNGVLYVSNFHRTYARSSGRKNAYITALDPKTGRMRWRSRALVCNTQNFLVHGSAIITGYGFTAEPDFLYVLDRNSGAIVQTVPVKSGPEWVISKGNRLHVRTYDTDYVFRIKS